MALVLFEKRGRVAIVTLNNPDQYNAMRPGLLPALNSELRTALEDGDIRSILLTGAGKGFCSGAALGGDSFGSGANVGTTLRRDLNPVVARMRAAGKPIVVAVNGPAAGAGVGLALAGDITLAAKSAKFILSFVRLGAALDAGTSLFIQRSVGIARARALAMLGEPISAEQAEDWGLIWKAVEDTNLFQEAMSVAQKLADGPPIAVRLIKSQIEASWSAPLSEALEGEADAQGQAFSTDDLREGARAFVEKRLPDFKGI